jgi:hypothetical protein
MELKSLITCPDHHSLGHPRRSNWTYSPRTGSKFAGLGVSVDVGKIGVLVTSGNDVGNVLEGSGEMFLQAQTSITIKYSDILILKKYFIFPPKTSFEQISNNQSEKRGFLASRHCSFNLVSRLKKSIMDQYFLQQYYIK